MISYVLFGCVRILQFCGSVQSSPGNVLMLNVDDTVQFQFEIRKISFRSSRSLDHVLVFQRTAKKCTKIYNARAQPLFCALNLLFCGVLVAVFVVICH